MADPGRSMRVVKTDLPGLWDCQLPDGRMLFDLTTGQIEHLSRENGWDVLEVSDLPATDAHG